MMTRRSFLSLAAQSLGAAAISGGFQKAFGQRAQKPPNIIVMVADDLGIMDLNSYAARTLGAKRSDCYYETPNLDALADESVSFTRAYSCPLCSPARTQIFTGFTASHWGFMTAATGNNKLVFDLPDDQKKPLLADHGSLFDLAPVARPASSPLTSGSSQTALASGAPGVEGNALTLAEALPGYRSGFIGKWHIGGFGAPGFQPADQGYEVIAYLDGGGSPYKNWRPVHSQTTKRFDQPIGNPGKDDTGKDYLTDDYSLRAVRWIEECVKDDKPFYLHFSQFAVHSPYQAKKEDEDYFQNKSNKGWNGHKNPTYAGMLKSMDDSVGALKDCLQKNGQWDNTIFVFVSDNGGIGNHGITDKSQPATCNLPFRGWKATLYEGGVRVPFMVKAPGVSGGSVCDIPVDSEDIFPTVMDLTGTSESLRQYQKQGGEGQSLKGVLKDVRNLTQSYTRDTFYWHYPFYVAVSLPNYNPRSAIAEGKWKLIFDWHGYLELFDLATDPFESTNLVDQHPTIALPLFKKLLTWIDKNVSSQYLPKVNPKYDGSVPEDGRPYRDLVSMVKQEPFDPKVVCKNVKRVGVEAPSGPFQDSVYKLQDAYASLAKKNTKAEEGAAKKPAGEAPE